MMNMARYASTSDQCTLFVMMWMAHPHVIMPNAVPAFPRRLNHAYKSPLLLEVLRWATMLSSMARNGPISLPLRRGQRVVS